MNELMKIIGERRQLAMIIAIATFFFVFLGMRIPYIKGDFHNPKQRPRAVVENVIKLKQAVAQLQFKLNHISVVSVDSIDNYVSPLVAVAPIAAACQHISPRKIFTRSLSSRAPPYLIFFSSSSNA